MTATAPTQVPGPGTEQGSGMRVVYWIIGAVLVVLVVVGLITYSANKQTAEAQQKAAQLTQKFKQAGLPVPADQAMIERSLGNDGGSVCENPANALGRAVLF